MRAEAPTQKNEGKKMENEKIFIECEIKRESEKALLAEVEIGNRVYRNFWFPKSRTEKGTIQPANGTGERSGIFTEEWLLEAKLRELGVGWQKTVSIWGPMEDGSGFGIGMFIVN